MLVYAGEGEIASLISHDIQTRHDHAEELEVNNTHGRYIVFYHSHQNASGLRNGGGGCIGKREGDDGRGKTE